VCVRELPHTVHKAAPHMFRKIPSWVQMVVLSTIIVPFAIFTGGSWLIGPYEGSFGIIGFFFSIYSDALKAQPAAWLLLLAAPMLVFIWRIALRKRG
ncbi:MAG: hypothetical protein P8M26_03015, partial [Gammaproteobacteria bacterium]|nr:hypothetical protein [Gammaproteobacteria bacterium]